MIKMIKTIIGACFYIMIIASTICIFTYLIQDLTVYYTSPVSDKLPLLIRFSNYIISTPIVGNIISYLINLLQGI